MSGNIYITSDTHFGHDNSHGGISKMCGRPFDNIRDMDAALIININRVVGENDVLYHLGDFSYRAKRPVQEYRDDIACQTIHLIRGNHDPHNKRDEPKPILFEMFETISDLYTLKLTTAQCASSGASSGARIIMCHYPLRTWNGYCRGTYHAHGHVHGRTYEGRAGLCADVGVDAVAALLSHGRNVEPGDYRPISLDEFVYLMEVKRGD